MDILVKNQQSKMAIDIHAIRETLSRILNILKCDETEISLMLVDNEGIREINRQYLNRDRPTNVIAFSMQEGEYGQVNPFMLGDIIISVETAQSDAEKGDMALEDMLAYLMIHGTLHLLGYEHETSPLDAEKMQKKEREVFFSLRKYAIE